MKHNNDQITMPTFVLRISPIIHRRRTASIYVIHGHQIIARSTLYLPPFTNKRSYSPGDGRSGSATHTPKK